MSLDTGGSGDGIKGGSVVAEDQYLGGSSSLSKGLLVADEWSFGIIGSDAEVAGVMLAIMPDSFEESDDAITCRNS